MSYRRAMDNPLDDWFVREILVHEAALVQYLRRCWSQTDDLHDLRQEVYVRVYEAAARSLPQQPKSFLFATARHLMTDRLRRGRIVSIEPAGDFESLNVLLVDEVSPEHRLGARQILKHLAAALDRLPERCRQIVWLRRVEELPQKTVAAKLGISEKAVEKQIAKGMRLLAEHYHGRSPAPKSAGRGVKRRGAGRLE
ncbi:MAG TPA: sigma-70 family RNA polymerase sigma factor [Tahibacter sp.]|uniref:RNA polymerase sigma factor n=1 Tax=Tahibacter sp. TaxID=2056211 RepID=UPI002B6CCE53|nr:sigma-70 family RNA polymerase sigma factor [Tahibacter sp.]HSX58582.1 sigma-70 family RNA polymerase sigma factor [Tahibacter sp.]